LMPFLALVIALSAIPSAQQQEREQKTVSLLFPLQEQEVKDGHLLYSLIAQSRWPLLRVTGWGNAGVAAATKLLERLLPGTGLQVAGQHYHVQAVDVTNSGWAGISTWEDFLAPPIGRFFRFQFGTPLVLQAPPFAPGASSFPVPPLFFGKLAQRWHALGGPALPINEMRLATWLQDGGCIVADYRLQGRPLVLSPGCRTLGFLGHITYRCREETPVEQQMLTALARFAFFAGSGLAVAQGLGATQVAVDS
jgi:CRISPR/Cas system endoribonuclease Cas6 (RAMP superfamily)